MVNDCSKVSLVGNVTGVLNVLAAAAVAFVLDLVGDSSTFEKSVPPMVVVVVLFESTSFRMTGVPGVDGGAGVISPLGSD